MATLTPMRFQPVFQRYLWGGRRLASLFGKPLGEGDDYAESWEVVDREDAQSVVANGPRRGATLRELMSDYGPELLGRHHPQPRFPLLLKLLDCNRTLSVQVHPNDDQAAQLDPPDLGKTEAWFVLAAEPDSALFAGLKSGVNRAALEQHLRDGTCHECLHRVQPKVGDCVFIRPGTVHALGAGLVVAELQQNSNATLRLFDWNRVGADGKPRPLHVDQALPLIDYESGPVQPQSPATSSKGSVQRLVQCDKFVWDRWAFDCPQEIGGDGCHVVCVIDGRVELAGDPTGQSMEAGDTIVLPACAGSSTFSPQGNCVLLDGYLP